MLRSNNRTLWLGVGLGLLLGNGCLQPTLRGPGALLSSNLTEQGAPTSGDAAALTSGDAAALTSDESFSLTRGQLLFHTNFYLPPTHPLIEDVVALRTDVFRTLRCEPGTEPIRVYLYRSPQDLARIVQQTGDPILQRRAYFLQTPDALHVYASWTYDIGTDLRHELTHGYLHSVQPRIPLWLDEGLAEYFEVARTESGRHADHLAHLAALHRAGQLNLELERLEQVSDPAKFEQTDYAASWLWVSWLLSRPDTTTALAEYFAALPSDASSAPPLSAKLNNLGSDHQRLIREYLEQRITNAPSLTR